MEQVPYELVALIVSFFVLLIAVAGGTWALTDLRTDLTEDIRSVRTELRSEIAELRREMKLEVSDTRAELKEEIRTLRRETVSTRQTSRS